MTNVERANKLLEAARIILEVRDSFSNTKFKCECCGFARFTDHHKHLMREQLNGAITRINRVNDRMLSAGSNEDWDESEENPG